MGEVYRGRDTKLGREVAIKVLPASVARDPERLARFEREAKVLASLNHPNIAQIYGVQEAEGYQALVMELVPGQTLGAHIKAGTIPLDESLRLATQMVEALSAAHEKGITHRDFKPANVMITPEGVVKVLDFGLAAVSQPSADSTIGTNVATLTMSPTSAGMIMGTAPYMSPEQARGNQADRRSDIFSFGVVLHEMLTGKQPFHGETVSDILASVLKDNPSLDDVPEQVRPLLQRCLQKDPRKRLQSIGDWDLLLTIGSSSAGGAGVQHVQSAPSQSRFGVVSIAAAVLAVGLGAVSFIHFRETPPEQPRVQFGIPLPGKATNAMFEISPDGRNLAMVVTEGSRRQLWIRPLDSGEARALPDTEGAIYPFWSPDSAYIGYFADGKVKKIAVSGGSPQTLCETPGA
jgi:serine/threonine-protein kinase